MIEMAEDHGVALADIVRGVQTRVKSIELSAADFGTAGR